MSALSLTQSQGVNVLRWSALAFGILYGFNRQRSISSSSKAAEAQHEWDRKQKLIDQAKLEWAKKTLPAQAKTASGDVITDPNDKNFDLEAYLKKVEVESQ